MLHGSPRTAERPLIGRDDLIRELAEALDGHQSLVLHGPAGVGKTLLARWAAERGTGDRPPLWVQGASGLAAVPLGALAPSLDRVAVDVADAAAVATKLLDMSAASLPLCIVDDLQWVDDLSIGVVQQLVTVHRVPVLATTRSDEPLPVSAAAFQRAAGLRTIDVAPLDIDGVSALVADLLGGPVDAKLSAALAGRSGGNPLFASELAAGGVAAGAVVAIDGVWTLRGELVPSRVLRDVVAARFAGLDPAVTEAAELLAVANHLWLEHADACLGDEALTGLERAGLLHFRSASGRELVELDHPVYGEVLRSGIGPLGRRSYCRRLAESLVAASGEGHGAARSDDDEVRLARWQLVGGIDIAPEVGARVARIAYHRFDHDLAIELARRSFDAAPEAGTGNLLAEVLHVRGRHDEAHAVLVALLTLESDEQEQATTAVLAALSSLHADADPATARATITAALASITDPASRLSLLTSQVYVVLMSEDFGELPGAVAALTAEFPPQATMASRQLVTGARLVHGQLDEAVALITTPPLRADDLFVRASDLENMSGGLQGLALARSGRLDEAEDVARRSHRHCVAEGDGRSQSMAAVALSLVALEKDDAETARAWALDAQRALDGILAPNLACAANGALLLAAAELGDADATTRATVELDRFRAGPDRLYVAVGERGRGVALAAGSPAAGVAHLRETADLYLAIGADEFCGDLRYEALRFRPPTGEDGAVFAALAGRCSGPLVAIRDRHVQALLRADLDGVVGVVDDLLELGAVRMGRTALDHAIELASTQGYERRARELRYRRDALGRRAGANDIGRLADAASNAAAGSAWDLLTPREADIAARAAAGHPSKRIAADLDISRRTVDNTLQRVFTKLGVTSRAELIDLVPQDPVG